MRVLIVRVAEKPKKQPAPDYGRPEERRRLEIAQVIALARHMRDSGQHSPMIIGEKASELEKCARDLELPFLAAGPLAMLKIWNWQRRFANLGILAVEKSSLSLAGRLRRLHGPKRTELYWTFFLDYPQLSKRQLKFFPHVNKCFCGSEAVRDWLLEKTGLPDSEKFKIVPPGLELGRYSFPPQKTAKFTADRHFVFGMANSLQPSSGALLVIRAMAAMWQKDDLPPWEVRMFGEGPRYAEILEEASNLGVVSRLSILANQPLGEVTSSCSAWIAPGSDPCEFPEALWAGIAAGLPTICSQNPLHQTRLFGSPAALKVSKNNPQELAKAMIALMREAKLQRRLTANGDKIRPQTSVDQMARTICQSLPNKETKSD